jgi:chromosome segregation protein
MRIKKVEITGFKSFVDRTVVTMDAPICGVVGPNGCGKSNVVDAIRWAMGEQSAKHLRGRAMEDVIFNGSENRGPHGVAEVSLYFENDDGKVPLSYANYSEIVVTRRLFRTGDSEYLINKGPCRLMDVTDLFLGTGVGTKAYSIIEQGKVGLIVSSKPEERRTFIEEAAGITKFKIKKKAAEKKMELTRQNLLRVGDIVGEVEKSLGSLRRQAQKAERYKAYKTELRDLELCDASQRWLGYMAEEGVRRTLSAELTEQHQAKETLVFTLEADAEAVRLDLLSEESRLQAEQEKLYEIDNRVQLLGSTIEFKERESRGAKERGLTAAEEVGDVERSEEQARKELTCAQDIEAYSQKKTEEVQAALAQVEGQIGELRKNLTAAEVQQESVRRKQAQAQADVARIESTLRAHELRRGDLSARAIRLAEEVERVDGSVEEEGERVRELERGVQELRQLGLELAQEKEGLRTREVELKKELHESERRLEGLRRELNQRASRLKSLGEIAARYEGFQKGPKAIMQRRRNGWQSAAAQDKDDGGTQAGDGILALAAEVLEAPSELEVALEAVLGDRLGAVIVSGHADAREAIDFLKTSLQGRATFVPQLVRFRPEKPEIDADEEGLVGRLRDLVKPQEGYEYVADYLIGPVLVAKDLEAALKLWRLVEAGTVIVTLAGEVLDASGALSGGSTEGAKSVVFAQRREMKELETRVHELEREITDGTARHEAMKQEMEKVKVSIDGVVRRAHEGDLERARCSKDLERARADFDRARSRKVQLAEERLQLDDQRGELESEAEKLKKHLQAAHEAVGAHEQDLDAHIGDLARMREALDEAAKEQMIQKVRDAEVRAERESAERTRARLADTQRDLASRAARLRKTIVDSREMVETLTEEVETARAELDVKRAEQSERKGRFGEQRGAYEDRRLAHAQAQAELRAHRHQLEELSEQRSRAQLALSKLEMARQNLEAQIDERYRLVLGHEVGDFHLRPLLTESELSRIDELRGLIERMGEVNLTALEEYAEAEKRYDYLTKQKTDLEDALEQLESAITKMNKESRERFREAFEAVNSRFQLLFPQLFRGGRAELLLTGGEDLLEAGVDIIAQPPGKKPATIDLLSGGEKALTAVSLIFAIFQYKPSPFCILDEVDAPLDEANVGRYNELIREMSSSSQFIVITHNKRTMEICDTLYGVTMEEPGVSKLVSVNMRTDAPRSSGVRAA